MDACHLWSSPPAPSGETKIWGIQAGVDPDNQPSSSYCFPIIDVSVYILADSNDCISSTSLSCSSRRFLSSFPVLGHTASITTGLKGRRCYILMHLPCHHWTEKEVINWNSWYDGCHLLGLWDRRVVGHYEDSYGSNVVNRLVDLLCYVSCLEGQIRSHRGQAPAVSCWWQRWPRQLGHIFCWNTLILSWESWKTICILIFWVFHGLV